MAWVKNKSKSNLSDHIGKRLSEKVIVSLCASSRAKQRWVKEGPFMHQLDTEQAVSLSQFRCMATKKDDRFQLLELPGGIYFGQLNSFG
jgi:hypothetical protein